MFSIRGWYRGQKQIDDSITFFENTVYHQFKLMDEDGLLEQLALEAGQYSLGTIERQRIVNRLLRELSKPGQLCRPACPAAYQGCYEEIHAVGKQKLFLDLYLKIHLYNPSRGKFLAWVNWLFKTRFPDAIKEYINLGKNLDSIIVSRNSPEKVSQIPDPASASDNLPLSKQVIQCIKEDPEGIFKATYTSGNPRANFHYIALKILEGYKWKELSEELGVPVQNLSNFYQRCLKKFKQRIRDYLSD